MHVQQVRLHNTDFKHRQWCKTHKATQWFLKGRGLFCSNQMNHLNLTQQRMLKTKLDPQKTAWQSILKEETQLCFLLMIVIICPITCEPFKIFVKCLELKLNHFQHINMVGDKYEDFEMIVSAQKKEKIKNTHKLGQFTIIVQGDRCNITGCTFVQKGRCVVSEEQVATDDISQENTRMHTERRPWTNEVDLFNISDFFPQKIGLWGQGHWHQICLRFLVNVPTVWIWSSTSLKLSCSRDFQKTWSLTLILRFRWLRFKFFQYF